MTDQRHKDLLWIVTGASGHLGNTVVRELLRRGLQVRAFILEQNRPEALKGLACEVVSGDLTDRASLEPLFAHTEGKRLIVLHLASMISIYDDYDPRVYNINVQGTRHLLNASKEHGVERFLYCGSVHAIPVPESSDEEIFEIKDFSPDRVRGCYAKTKAIAASEVLKANTKEFETLVVLPSGIIGPNDYLNSHMTKLIQRVVDRTMPAMIKGGYNFVDVRDVADGMIAAAIEGQPGEVYNLSGTCTTIQDMMNIAAELSGRKPFKRLVPLWVVKIIAPIAAYFGKITRKTPLLTPYSLFTMTSPCAFSNKKARAKLGFSLRPLRETIRDTVYFMAKHTRFRKVAILKKLLTRSSSLA